MPQLNVCGKLKMWTNLKPFEQDLHDKYDQPAKDAVARFLTKNVGLRVESNPNQYGVDLLLFRGDKEIGGAEVEVRQWSPACPYSTIHIPQRKRKFFGERVLFFALTKDMKSAYWITTYGIDQYPLREVRNVKVASGEMFYDVPTKEFTFVDLITGESK